MSCSHKNITDILGDTKIHDEQTASCQDCGAALYRLIDDVSYLVYLGWDREYDTKIIGHQTDQDGKRTAIWATCWNLKTED